MTDQELLEAIRSIVKAEQTEMKGELSQMKDELSRMKGELFRMNDELFRVGAVLDNEVKPAIQLLAEGHENILEHMDQHIAEHTEPIELRVEALEVVTKRLNREMKELKRAQ